MRKLWSKGLEHDDDRPPERPDQPAPAESGCICPKGIPPAPDTWDLDCPVHRFQPTPAESGEGRA